jgi:hypothetical protein
VCGPEHYVERPANIWLGAAWWSWMAEGKALTLPWTLYTLSPLDEWLAAAIHPKVVLSKNGASVRFPFRRRPTSAPSRVP